MRKNLRYDTVEQETDTTYLKALGLIKILNRKFKYSDSITTSHEFIAYIMILMNYISAKELKKRKIGIYRSAKYNTTLILQKIYHLKYKNSLKCGTVQEVLMLNMKI